MEKVDCIICSSKKSELIINVTDRLSKEKKLYNIVKCKNCSFIFLNPRYNSMEIKPFYDAKAYDPHRKTFESIYTVLYSFVQYFTMYWKYRIIRRYFSKGSVLDIGGGNGKFVQFMNGKGWQATLQDSYAPIKNINKKYNFVKELSELKNKKFDLITLWHSIEHIHDQDILFKNIEDLLNKNGILMIAAPNIHAIEKKYFKENWVAYDAPRHLYHFDLQTINKLCNNKNFKIIKSYSLIQDTAHNILLSLKDYSIKQVIYGLIIFLSTISKILYRGPKYSSSFLIICKRL